MEDDVFDSRDDFVYHAEVDWAEVSLMDEMEWIENIKKYFVRMTFMDVAHHFEKRAIDFLSVPNDGTPKVVFLAAFLESDRYILPMMPYRSKEWKEKALMDFYQTVYNDENTSTRNKILSASYLLDRPLLLDEDVVSRIIAHLLVMQEENVNWDVFDLLHRHRDLMNEPHRQTFNQWDHLHRQEPPNVVVMHERAGCPPPLTMMTDSQNVHTTSINNSMKRCIDVLSHIPPCGLDFEEMVRHVVYRFPRVCSSLHRIRTDPSLFQSGSNRVIVRLSNVFEMVFSYIHDMPDPDIQSALWERLHEELRESDGTCCTGHLTRLINVLVGFHPDIHLTIDDIDHIKIRFSQILQRIVTDDESDDSITTHMIQPAPNGPFCRYLKKHRQHFFKELADYSPQQIDEAVWDLYPTLKKHPIFCPKRWSCVML